MFAKPHSLLRRFIKLLLPNNLAIEYFESNFPGPIFSFLAHTFSFPALSSSICSFLSRRQASYSVNRYTVLALLYDWIYEAWNTSTWGTKNRNILNIGSGNPFQVAFGQAFGVATYLISIHGSWPKLLQRLLKEIKTFFENAGKQAPLSSLASHSPFIFKRLGPKPYFGFHDRKQTYNSFHLHRFFRHRLPFDTIFSFRPARGHHARSKAWTTDVQIRGRGSGTGVQRRVLRARPFACRVHSAGSSVF